MTHPWSTWPLYTCRCRRWSPSWGWGWVWRACRRHTTSDHWRPEREGTDLWPSASAGSAPALWWWGCSLWSSGGRWAHTARSEQSGSYLTNKQTTWECHILSVLTRKLCVFWTFTQTGKVVAKTKLVLARSQNLTTMRWYIYKDEKDWINGNNMCIGLI